MWKRCLSRLLSRLRARMRPRRRGQRRSASGRHQQLKQVLAARANNTQPVSVSVPCLWGAFGHGRDYGISMKNTL